MTNNHDSEIGYTDASSFVRLFETVGRVRILDVLLGKHYTTLSVSDIAQLAEVHDTTVYRNIQELEDAGLVEAVDSKSGSVRYRLNKNNEVSKLLQKAHRELLGQDSDFGVTADKTSDFDPGGIPEYDNASISKTERKVANSVTKKIKQ